MSKTPIAKRPGAPTRCGECRFWIEEEFEPGKVLRGRCHRRPPVVVTTSEECYGPDDTFAVWPRTRIYDFCGEGEAWPPK
jgi:hypothetical protein